MVGKPRVLLRRTSRHAWGSDPRRVVVVAVMADGDRTYARTIGAEGGRAVELDSAEGVTLERGKPTRVRLADGSAWELQSIGCSCNVPPPLRGINPHLVPPA